MIIDLSIAASTRKKGDQVVSPDVQIANLPIRPSTKGDQIEK